MAAPAGVPEQQSARGARAGLGQVADALEQDMPARCALLAVRRVAEHAGLQARAGGGLELDGASEAGGRCSEAGAARAPPFRLRLRRGRAPRFSAEGPAVGRPGRFSSNKGNDNKPHARRADSMSDLEKLGRKSGKIAISGRYHFSRDIRDDYKVLDTVLGSGFNGEVKMAVEKGKPDGLKYAVKAFKLFNIGDDKRQQLRSEVEVFLCMDHPHVTRLYEVYDCEDYLHLVMECMEGGELFDRVIELKIFNEALAAEAVNQMLLALNYSFPRHCPQRHQA
ncbi:unnamed protein product [Prorocentrum cordatum]|uniref:Protein kinase domain-containing protein n=1 Tax=Prorocentrum cordatum TaxID=2364126 RepID=A0ABN9VZ29_9DINO|nr:unnamed protein product [Polarella glacialis]